MKNRLPLFVLIALLATSCKVEFSPNAPWKEVPSVYCVIDPQEDTVWARVQRCYLGEDNLYNYSTIFDSNNYTQGEIKVHLLAWRGVLNSSNHSIAPTDQLVDRWEMAYTEVEGKPDGSFSSGVQPMYYCVPGTSGLLSDTSCVFELVVLQASTGDTLAKAQTTMVGFLPYRVVDHVSQESNVIILPSIVPGHHFGFNPVRQNEIRWNTLPRGRMFQPSLVFYYRKNGDTLSLEVPGTVVKNQYGTSTLSSTAISQSRFLSAVKTALADNTDSLFTVNKMDIILYVCNEDLNAYISSQNTNVVSGQEFQVYSNIEGGVGVFGSRRTHIKVNVPCDSNGRKGYLPDLLKGLGVGFYGQFSSQ